LGLGLFLKPLQIKILLMNVSHNSSFWRKRVATEFSQEWPNIVKHNSINGFIMTYSYIVTFNDIFRL
jgi:hypothetical protein